MEDGDGLDGGVAPVLEAGVMKAHEKAAGVGLPVERMLGWNPAEREP